MSSIAIATVVNVDNHNATKVLRMAEKFFADPENQRKYKEWHLKEYGCLPEDAEKEKKRV